MQKTINPWAESGDKEPFVPNHDAKVATGWEANNEPKAENWNYVQNSRDTFANRQLENEAMGFHGVNPASLYGTDSRRIPRMRPNEFDGSDNLWLPGSAANVATSPGAARIDDATMGWDPAKGMPTIALAYQGAYSSGAESMLIRFIECWSYGTAPSYTDRTVYFPGFAVHNTAGACPILIADGYLYVVVTPSGGVGIQRIYKYDMVIWSGQPVGYLALSAMENYNELVEISSTSIGTFVQAGGDGSVRICKIKKDLSEVSYTTSPLSGESITAIKRFCRTDGTYLYTSSVQPSTFYPQILYAPRATPSAIVLSTQSVTYANYRIADIYPLAMGSLTPHAYPVIACLTYKTVAPYRCGVRVVGMNAAFDFTNSRDFAAVDFDWTKPGCFCGRGSQAYLIHNRIFNGTTVYGSARKFDPASLSLAVDAGTTLYPAGSGVSGYFGGALSWTAEPRYLTAKGFHDGRNVWAIDMFYGTAYRVVAADTRQI